MSHRNNAKGQNMTKTDSRIVFYAQGHRPPDQHSRIYIPIFEDITYAKAWLDFFIDGEEVRREGNTLHLDSGMRVRCDLLETLLSCGDTETQLSNKDTRRVLRFKYGSWDEKPVAAVRDKTKSPEVERERRPERPPGYVTITELCALSGMPAMIARAALRASGRAKPSYGWAFDPKDVPEIKEICGMR